MARSSPPTSARLEAYLAAKNGTPLDERPLGNPDDEDEEPFGDEPDEDEVEEPDEPEPVEVAPPPRRTQRVRRKSSSQDLDESLEELEPVAAQVQPPVDITALRERLLQHLTQAEQELISDADLLAIKAKQDKKAADERKKDVLEKLEGDLLHRARVEQGLLSVKTLRTAAERQRLAEKVRVRIELPGATLQHIPGFRIDGRLYEAGREYEITRAELESMADTHYRIHLNEIRSSVLDQDRKVGITLNSKAQGTTAAHALFAQSPIQMRVSDVVE